MIKYSVFSVISVVIIYHRDHREHRGEQQYLILYVSNYDNSSSKIVKHQSLKFVTILLLLPSVFSVNSVVIIT